MPMALNWRKGPYLSIILVAFGLGVLLQIPIIYHAQNVLLIESYETLVITGLSMAIVLGASFILILDAISDKWEVRPYEKIDTILVSISSVIIIYYILYFGIYALGNVDWLVAPVYDFLRTLHVEYSFVIVEITSVTLLALLSLYINIRLKKQFAFTGLKRKKKK